MGLSFPATLGERALKILAVLKDEYPHPKIALRFSDPLQLLVATILSAQCTDERVNRVTENLFNKYRRCEDYVKAPLEELERDIKPTGFYKSKARYLKGTCQVLMERFHSQVPDNMQDLLTLPGVARKTANIVLSNAFGKNEGIAVDTHVRRLTKRLGLTEEEDPDKVEMDLMKLIPKPDWRNITLLLMEHGRKICKAKNPLCEKCRLNNLCPSAFKT